MNNRKSQIFPKGKVNEPNKMSISLHIKETYFNITSVSKKTYPNQNSVSLFSAFCASFLKHTLE